MIKAKELRIDNYVNVRNSKHLRKISHTGHHGFINVHLTGNHHKYSISLSSKELKPIPLTEEILLKCGYIKQDRNMFMIIGHVIWNVQENLFLCDKNGVVLKYLHQLQNLYFALTNKELEINL